MKMKPRKKKSYSTFLLLLLTIVIVSSSVGVTIAWLTAEGYITNEFVIGKTDISISETFDAQLGIKEEVSIKNDGNVPIYVRATVQIYWEDTHGNILSETPVEGKDYNIVDVVEDCWEKNTDGFYYYTIPLDENESTDYLIERCEELSTFADGRVMVVDIISQSIQAESDNAVLEAWEVAKSENGTLVITGGQ